MQHYVSYMVSNRNHTLHRFTIYYKWHLNVETSISEVPNKMLIGAMVPLTIFLAPTKCFRKWMELDGASSQPCVLLTNQELVTRTDFSLKKLVAATSAQEPSVCLKVCSLYLLQELFLSHFVAVPSCSKGACMNKKFGVL